jgi:hypothetical protein
MFKASRSRRAVSNFVYKLIYYEIMLLKKIQNFLRGKVNILGGHSIGHSKKKFM